MTTANFYVYVIDNSEDANLTKYMARLSTEIVPPNPVMYFEKFLLNATDYPDVIFTTKTPGLTFKSPASAAFTQGTRGFSGLTAPSTSLSKDQTTLTVNFSENNNNGYNFVLHFNDYEGYSIAPIDPTTMNPSLIVE